MKLSSCTAYTNMRSLSSSVRFNFGRNKNRKYQHSWQWKSLLPPVRIQVKRATKTLKLRKLHLNNLPTAPAEPYWRNAVTSQAMSVETVLSPSYTQTVNSIYSLSSLDQDAEGENLFINSGSVVVRENLQTEKVVHANKGKIPWNKGRRHSAGTCP